MTRPQSITVIGVQLSDTAICDQMREGIVFHVDRPGYWRLQATSENRLYVIRLAEVDE